MLIKTAFILGGPRIYTAIVTIASLALIGAGRRASALLLIVGVGGAGLLRVEAETPTRVSLDGEIAGRIPGDFELAPHPHSVRVAPRPAALLRVVSR